VSNVQVKNLQPELHEQLRQRAAQSGQTISDYVLELVRRDLGRPQKQQWLDRARQLHATGRSSSEIIDIVQQGRRREPPTT
jgi:plasmid stability protein